MLRSTRPPAALPALLALLAVVLAALGQRFWSAQPPSLAMGTALFFVSTSLLLAARHMATP